MWAENRNVAVDSNFDFALQQIIVLDTTTAPKIYRRFKLTALNARYVISMIEIYYVNQKKKLQTRMPKFGAIWNF